MVMIFFNAILVWLVANKQLKPAHQIYIPYKMTDFTKIIDVSFPDDGVSVLCDCACNTVFSFLFLFFIFIIVGMGWSSGGDES